MFSQLEIFTPESKLDRRKFASRNTRKRRKSVSFRFFEMISGQFLFNQSIFTTAFPQNARLFFKKDLPKPFAFGLK